jgi:hypothetical protein
MPHNVEPIFYGDVEVRDKNGLISLTDMWIAADKPFGKHEPILWGLEVGSEFIDFIAKKYNVGRENVYKTSRGKFGGVWAHWQIALDYAKYLSPEFHAWANQVIKERVEEDHDPELGIERSRDRAINTWKKQGKDDANIQTRINGIKVRNVFTDTLKKSGVENSGYAICTNNIYKPILGGTASEIRTAKGLSKKANVRDEMSTVELAGTMFAEALATDKIKREKREGLNQCASACLKSGMDIKLTLDKHEASINKPIYVEKESQDTFLGDRLNKLRNKKKP